MPTHESHDFNIFSVLHKLHQRLTLLEQQRVSLGMRPPEGPGLPPQMYNEEHQFFVGPSLDYTIFRELGISQLPEQSFSHTEILKKNISLMKRQIMYMNDISNQPGEWHNGVVLELKGLRVIHFFCPSSSELGYFWAWYPNMNQWTIHPITGMALM
jgi:hypothetical protein